MRIWYDNEIYKCDITASSEETSYAATKLQNTQLKATTRTTTVSTVGTWDFDAGYGVTINANSAAILGHNIATAASAIQFIMSANSNYTSPSTSVVFSHDTGLMSVYFTADSKRYARILVDDPANSDGFIEMGLVYIASHLQVVGGVGIDFPFQPLDSSTGDYSNSGQFFGDEGETLDLYDFHMPYINNALKVSMLTVFDKVKTVKPIIMDFNENAHSAIVPLYCKFNDTIAFNHIAVAVGSDYDFHWNCDISLKECK